METCSCLRVGRANPEHARALLANPMRNHLLIGNADKTDRILQLATDHFLLIDDGPIIEAFLQAFPHARLFDITQHSFNPLRGIGYLQARDFATALYTASPEGKDTLTVRNGKRALLRLLLDRPTRLDALQASTDDPGELEAVAMLDDILLSPVLKNVLCKPTNFSFKGVVLAKLDRATIGDFDAFLLATLLVGHFKGHIIIPDFGFYGRDFYMSFIRQNRLVAGLNFLSELPPKLSQAVLSIKDKTVYRTTREDAERLVFYLGISNPSVITDLAEGETLTV